MLGIGYSVEGGVARIVISREDFYNAFNSGMWADFSSSVRTACSSPEVFALVVEARGRWFSVGYDVEELLGIETVEASRRYFQGVRRAFTRLLECRKPVIAAVQGPALSAGAELLLASDVVIASRSASVGFPDARLGLIPPVLSTLGIYILGYRRAKAMAMTGAVLAASEARDVGLVDLVVDPDIIGGAVRETVEYVRRSPQTSLGSIKEAVTASVRPALEAAYSKLELMVLSREARERMRRCLESGCRIPGLGELPR